MKKILAIVTCIILAFTAMPMEAFNMAAKAESTECSFEYSIENDEVTIISIWDRYYYGDIEIPSMLEGYPVTNIGDNAFAHCFLAENITIPNTVIRIGATAFMGCDLLTSITIPENVSHFYVNLISDEGFVSSGNMIKL